MDVCATCHQPREIDGVQHPMLLSASRGLNSAPEDVIRWHLGCLPADVEAEHRNQHGAEIDAAKAALHKGI